MKRPLAWLTLIAIDGFALGQYWRLGRRETEMIEETIKEYPSERWYPLQGGTKFNHASCGSYPTYSQTGYYPVEGQDCTLAEWDDPAERR